MSARLRAIDLRGEAGMTLPELLISMVIGTIVLLAAFALLDTTVGVTARVDRNVDSVQRGRRAMDTIVRDLRSQVCLPNADPALPDTGSLSAGSETSVDFYADLGDGTAAKPPQRRVIVFDAAQRTLVESIYIPTGTAGNYNFSVTPVRRTLLTDVVQDGSAPVFSYYGWDTSTPRQAIAPLTATSGLAAADLDKVARIAIAFRVRRTGGTAASTGAVSLQEDVYRRAFDPNLTEPTPGCW